MILHRIGNKFALTGNLEELARLQSTAYYAKEHLYHQLQVAWNEDRAPIQKIYDETLQLELTLE